MNRNFGQAYLSPAQVRARARANLKFFETLTTPFHQREGVSAAPESGEIRSDELRAHARQGWIDIQYSQSHSHSMCLHTCNKNQLCFHVPPQETLA